MPKRTGGGEKWAMQETPGAKDKTKNEPNMGVGGRQTGGQEERS